MLNAPLIASNALAINVDELATERAINLDGNHDRVAPKTKDWVEPERDRFIARCVGKGINRFVKVERTNAPRTVAILQVYRASVRRVRICRQTRSSLAGARGQIAAGKTRTLRHSIVPITPPLPVSRHNPSLRQIG